MISLFQFLADLWSEWVRNGPELLGIGPRHFRNTSGALLGHNLFFKKTSQNHETSTCLKTNLFEHGWLNVETKADFCQKQKDAYQNSASFDVPDSSPSFNLTPFVTKT